MAQSRSVDRPEMLNRSVRFRFHSRKSRAGFQVSVLSPLFARMTRRARERSSDRAHDEVSRLNTRAASSKTLRSSSVIRIRSMYVLASAFGFFGRPAIPGL